MRRLNIVAVISVALIGAGVMAWLYFDRATTKLCDDIIFSKITTRDQNWIATSFIRNCDEETGDTTVLNIQPTYEMFDPDRGCLIFIAKGRAYALRANWLDDSTLEVRQGFHPDAVMRQLDRCLQISVRHVTTNENEATVPPPGITVVPAQ